MRLVITSAGGVSCRAYAKGDANLNQKSITVIMAFADNSDNR